LHISTAHARRWTIPSPTARTPIWTIPSPTARTQPFIFGFLVHSGFYLNGTSFLKGTFFNGT
jgi:hypothetical protein